MHATVEDIFAEGDKVAVRWTFRGAYQGKPRQGLPAARAAPRRSFDTLLQKPNGDSRVVGVERQRRRIQAKQPARSRPSFESLQRHEHFNRIRLGVRGFLDFQRIKPTVSRNKEVDFPSILIAKVIQIDLC